MQENIDTMTAKISLKENAAYFVSDGHLTKVTPKSFGIDIFHWKDGKVLDVERTQRIRNCGQDVI